ncbi:hypothetical protein N7478_005404 [Penicillium angulare]|uniref:uncharacterized protein n=1 Tax=Penicillium angulare TaxID=116970 RepID=UPI00254235BE|nr:uncharacterized protein N7478_005404 [Penicillium angulare]KAJ5280032.1 hypothetical protein N7478_005404 [Penicillium angulare]
MDPEEIDDPLLRQAIEASLRDLNGDSEPSASRQPSDHVVDLTNDSDDHEELFPKSKATVGSDTDDEAEQEMQNDEELRRAIAMSLQDQYQGNSPFEGELQTEQPDPPPMGMLGLDRKQMEAERRARLEKRKAENSVSSPEQSPTKVSKVEDRLGANQNIREPKTVTQPSSSTHSASPMRPTARPGIQWPLGIVKKTHVLGTERGSDEIRIEEVIQRADLELAVFSSFLWDMDWLFTKCDLWRTRFILIMSAKEQVQRDQMNEETKGMKNLRLCFPPMPGQVNIMHSKLMLLFHPEYLRIVVPTANLTLTDWGENKLMENTAFLIDLPLKANHKTPSSKTFFHEELVHFLKASTLNENVIAKMDKFDFTETKRYAFVHTIGGTNGPNSEESWRRTGYCGLGRAVSHLGLRSFSPINIDFVASSIGSLNDEFLRAMYLSCKGDDGLAEYAMRYNNSSSVSQSANNHHRHMMKAGDEWRDRFRVYFPSDKTARRAHQHPEETAGTVCFQSKWWKAAKFPKHVLRDCVSHKTVLMHNKLAFVWPSEPIALENNQECKGWAYIGSANLSESAWGRLVKDRTENKPKLNCRNWESGVLVPIITPIDTASDSGKRSESSFSEGTLQVGSESSTPKIEASNLPTEIFQGTVPVPMKVPAPALSQSRPPWFFMGRD